MLLSQLPANDLAKLCSDTGNRFAWNEFVYRFHKPIALAVKRKAAQWHSASPEIVDDLVQEIFLRLCADDCRILKVFVPKGPDSIVGYLVVVARNVAHDHFRAGLAQKTGGDIHHLETDDGDLDFLPGVDDPADSAHRTLRMNEIDRALKSLMPQPVTERDYIIFWMHFQQGFTAREISEIPSFGLSIKGVEALIHRLKALLRTFFGQK